jgi:tetratricopeptide (TPR) repeat protein
LPLLLVFGGLSIARNTEWVSNATLYEADLLKAPANMKMNYNYANSKLALSFDQQNPHKMADYEASLKYYRKAIALNPKYQNALLGIGMAFYNFNAPDSSKHYLELALEAKPDYAMAMFYLANIHIQRKQYDSATRLMINAVKVEPTWIMAQYNLGACCQYLNTNDSAIAAFKRVLLIDPTYNNYKAYEFIANDYRLLGKLDSSTKYESLLRLHNTEVKAK